jgi:class 3 adenylate cyclase
MNVKLGIPLYTIEKEYLEDFNNELLTGNLKKGYLISLLGVVFLLPIMYLDWIRFQMGMFHNWAAKGVFITHLVFFCYLPLAIYMTIQYSTIFESKARKKKFLVLLICSIFSFSLLPMGILSIPNGGTIVVYGIFMMLINLVISINHFFRLLVNGVCLAIIIVAIIYFKKNDMNHIITSILECIGITLPAFVFATIHYNTKVKEYTNSKLLEKERDRSDQLLHNILPYETAQELKLNGFAHPKFHNNATILFTDFDNFSSQIAKIDPEELIRLLNDYFIAFDAICKKWHLEKIKTIGDAYMAVSGVPIADPQHALNTCQAAIEILDFVEKYKLKAVFNHTLFFGIRIGIHSGPVVSGVVGSDKFTFDIWGNAVNIASRMESKCEVGKINISGDTFQLVKTHFKTEYRGHIPVKNLGEIEMYFLKKP